MKHPEHMEDEAATRLTEKSRCATAAGATIRSVAGDARLAYRGAALVNAQASLAKASSPSAPSSVVPAWRRRGYGLSQRPRGPTERTCFQHVLREM